MTNIRHWFGWLKNNPSVPFYLLLFRIQERMKPQFDYRQAIQNQNDITVTAGLTLTIKPLLHFDDAIRQEEQTGIPFSLPEYLQLVDWTGRIIRDDKRGYIPSNIPPILQRLNIPPEQWFINSQKFEKIVHRRFRQSA